MLPTFLSFTFALAFTLAALATFTTIIAVVIVVIGRWGWRLRGVGILGANNSRMSLEADIALVQSIAIRGSTLACAQVECGTNGTTLPVVSVATICLST